MNTSETYHVGGYVPGKPNGNLAERLDGASGTYTRWDTDGNVLETRPLTDAEVASLTPAPVELTPEEKLAAARDALAVLDVIEAPVTAADLADVLVDVKTALEG